MVTPESIKAARVARGLTQAALAQMMGIQVMSISRYERGLTQPRGLHLARLLEVLPAADAAGTPAQSAEKTGTEG